MSAGILDPERARPALARWLAAELGADSVEIEGLARMSGGAIQENFALDVTVSGGPRAGSHALVLRTTAVAGVPVSLGRAEEYAVLQVAHAAGVCVPEPIAICDHQGVIGRPFYLMRRLPGIAPGRLLVRDEAVLARGDAIVESLGRELAKLHRVTPPDPRLGFLSHTETPAPQARIADLRAGLDRLGAPEPVLEWGLRWLELNAPPSEDLVLCHGDCRTGNYLVHDGALSALLDWEFALWSDPLEDIGWMCARCWRFGNDRREAGGIGTREAFYRGWEAKAGRELPRAHVAWWEIFGTIRWAVIALQQAERHLSGKEPSLELALTGHVLPELELDILEQVAALSPADAGERDLAEKRRR